tara:strand:+ start:103 stop:471 length:369 start_codon:yes stop_codon:yes gene_type:complete
MLPLCEEQSVSVLIAGPFNSGILATGPVPGAKYDYQDAPVDIMEKASRISSICQRHDVALEAASLQFPLSHPSVTSVVPGAMTPHEVLANVSHMKATIPPELWSELKEEGLIAESAPLPASM